MTNDEFKQFCIDCENEKEGDLHLEDGIVCEKCKNKGEIWKLINGYESIQKCECMKRRVLFQRAKYSGLGEYIQKTMDDYEAEKEWQSHLKASAEEYITNGGKHWFMMCGQSGAGKTLLCSIIANTLLRKGKQVLYITWTDFISRLKRDMMGDNTNAVTIYLEELKNVDVLFLDELLKKYNETDLKYLIEIINYRYTKGLKTLITSERGIKELLDVDEATFSRCVEMCGKYLLSIKKDRDRNYRLRGLS